MNGHPEFLELIATSIDFDLTDEEFGRLSTHLARCPECRRTADEMRGDATAIAAYPPPRLAPARSEQILRAALRTPRPQPRWGMLAVAAMLTTIGGGILFAGFQLINDDDATPSQPPPSLVAQASAPPSDEPPDESGDPIGVPPDDGAPATPNTDLGETPPAEPAALAFPIRYSRDVGAVRVAPAPEDRLWVSFTRGNDTVLALLESTGAPISGWPELVPNATDCFPLAAPDGSVRLLCSYGEGTECADPCGEDRVLAFAANGDAIPGFPVSFPRGEFSGLDRDHARMVGDSVVLTQSDGSEDAGIPEERWIAEVRPNGNVVLGPRVPAPLNCCVVGPNGVAYGSTVLEDEGLGQQTQLVAFDAHGMRSGWPILVEGSAVSYPGFGPNGQLVYTSWVNESSRIARLNPDGSEAMAPIDLAFPLDWAPDGDAPIPPLVDDRGRVWVVADASILGFDGTNGELPGFPYNAETDLLTQGGDCPPTDTGCQSWIEPPRLAPESLIYTLENPPEDLGGRLNVVNRDGTVRSGWPKTLREPGAVWDSVTIGANRRAYAVALEPEPDDKWSGSISGFAPNGTRELFKVLFEP